MRERLFEEWPLGLTCGDAWVVSGNELFINEVLPAVATFLAFPGEKKGPTFIDYGWPEVGARVTATFLSGDFGDPNDFIDFSVAGSDTLLDFGTWRI